MNNIHAATKVDYDNAFCMTSFIFAHTLDIKYMGDFSGFSLDAPEFISAGSCTSYEGKVLNTVSLRGF